MLFKKIFFISCILALVASTPLFAQTYTFTPAGATGRFGPTQTQINTTYTNTTLNGLVTVTNGIQNFTVPATGVYKIEAYGAKGGNGSSPNGGSGAKMQGDFSLTGGQVLKILVGQIGSNGLVGGGGGGSYVTDNSNTALIIAAGGGGAAWLNVYSVGSASMAGSSGTSGMPGSNGNASITASSGGSGGNGGSTATTFSTGQGSGGGGFTGNGANGNPSTAGLSFTNGGTGGSGTINGTDIAGDGGFGGGGGGDWVVNTGAGGGGGYSGGGGGTYYGFGGGGGSFNSGGNQVNTSSVNAGNGYVVFTKISGVNIVQTSSVACFGQLTAALTASAFGGTAPYSYSWSPAGGTSSVASGLGAGTYTIRAVDAASVMYTNTFTISQPSLMAGVISQTNVSCFNGSNGVARILVSGGNAPYSYAWSPMSSFGSSVTGLSAGTYTCLFQDINNCTNSATVSITQPVALSVFGIASNPTVCSGGTSVLLGGGALTYTWSNGVTNAVAFTPTVTNNYTVTGADAAGCTATAITAIVVNPGPTLSISGSNTVCTGNSLVLTANGANTYTWNNSSNSPTLGITPALTTTYSVVGTNTNGCQNTAIKTVSVINTTVVNALATNSAVCIGNSVSLYGSGATTYTWSGSISNNVAFTPTLSDSYTVTGTGACGTASASITILVNALPSVTANASSTLICSGSFVTLFGSGANSYAWTGGIINNLPFTLSNNSTYTVTGTDVNGCQNTAVKSLSVNVLPLVTASVSSPVVCAGTPVTFNGGGANTYTWTGGATDNSPFSPGTSGSYVVTGTDLNGCSNTATTSVSVIIVPLVTANASSLSVCSGNTVSLFGGGALSYSWTSGVNNNVPFTPGSTSSYTVYGSNSCFTASNVITITVNNLPNITANATNSVVCFGNSTTLFGGGGISYSWSGGVTNNVSFIPSVSITYTITGTDANGCQNTATRLISVNSLPTVTASVSNAVVCFGNSSTLNGGGALTYTWSGNVINNVTFTPTVTATYTVTGTDVNSCTNTAVRSITVNPLPVVTITASSLAICIGNSVSLNGIGANTYTWTGGISNGTPFSPLVTSSYSVTGTNTLTGCTSTNTAVQTITVNPLPVVAVVVSNSAICQGGTVTLTGTNADVFNWTGGITNGLAFSPASTTIYTVTGTNTLTGCSNSTSQGIAVNALPSLSISASNLVICNGQSVTLNASGANTFTWTNGILNGVPFSPSLSTTYIVSGTNTLTGCKSSATQIINVNPLPVVTTSASSSSVCFGNTLTLSGLGANTYTWSGGVVNGQAFSPSVTSSYSLTGTNTITGCTSTNTAVQGVTVNALPDVFANTSASVLCIGETAILTAGGAQSYTWSTNEITLTISVSPSLTANYTLTGTDANGCKNTFTLNQEVSECLGLNNVQENKPSFVIFPNPNNGHFSVSTDLEIDLKVLNELGQVVKEFYLSNDNNKNYSVTDLPNGIYFIMGQKDGYSFKLKVVVAK